MGFRFQWGNSCTGSTPVLRTPFLPGDSLENEDLVAIPVALLRRVADLVTAISTSENVTAARVLARAVLEELQPAGGAPDASLSPSPEMGSSRRP